MGRESGEQENCGTKRASSNSGKPLGAALILGFPGRSLVICGLSPTGCWYFSKQFAYLLMIPQVDSGNGLYFL